MGSNITSEKQVLAVIPARGGSKGLPRKNILPLAGKPLIAYTIQVAKAVHEINRIIVSTDDEEIAEKALSLGAEVPFLRPPELSTDTAGLGEALLFTQDELFEREGYLPDLQIIMYPTHPFRKVSTVKGLVNHLLNGYSSVSTYKKVHSNMGGYFFESDGYLQQLLDQGQTSAKKTYLRSYGYFYGRSLHYEIPKQFAHVLEDEIELIDIDHLDDFCLAEEVVRQGLFDFEL